MSDVARKRAHYLARLWAEFNRMGGEHDAFIKVIILERIAKSLVLIALGTGLLIAGRSGWLTSWAQYAQEQLNLDSDSSVLEQTFFRVLALVSGISHTTVIAIGAYAYALLEGTEGVGLAMRKRWAEYLTVLATGALIPFEVYEVEHKVTLFRVGALLLNLAVVGYLAYSKRLFVGV